MRRRIFLQKLFSALFSIGFLTRLFRPAAALAEAEEEEDDSIERFAFGSCAIQDDPQPVWDAIGKVKPEFFVFLGDNVYADTEDMLEMKAGYDRMNAIPQFARFRKNVPLLATWDDHDYGQNDGGSDYPKKKESKEIMLDFFEEPKDSERRKREGVYESYIFGEQPKLLQVILLDLRWFRTSVAWGDSGYVPMDGDGSSLLGSEQWAWLEKQLCEPADLRILGSSVQFVSSEHPWEKWANFPHEKQRLIELIDKLKLRNLVVISGDMHFGEISKERTPGGVDLYDITASGLNRLEAFEGSIKNSKRLHYIDNVAHFGQVDISWKEKTVALKLAIKDLEGKVLLQQKANIPR